MSAQPCCDPECPDPMGGLVESGRTEPSRFSGAFFGVEGLHCKSCYARRSRYFRRRLDGKQERGPQGHRRGRFDAHVRTYRPSERPADPTAVATITELHAQRAEHEAQRSERRPCPASEAHYWVQPPGASAFAPFVCKHCGDYFVAPVDARNGGQVWPAARKATA